MAIKARNIIIVDDDESLRNMLTWEFQDLGYQVESSATCSEALALADHCQFDYALLDYGLPDDTGENLARKLANIQPNLNIVMMSGQVDKKTVTQKLQGLLQAFLVKPISNTRLRELFG